MESETVVFMPNGDVTLVLTRHVFKRDGDVHSLPAKPSAKPSPLRPLAEADDELSQRPSGVEPEALPEAEDDIVWYAPDPPGGIDGPLFPPPRRAARGSDASSRRDRSASPPASFWAALRRSAVIEEEEEVITPAEEEPDEIISSHEVLCVASSRHLMLASEFFRTALSGDSKEAKTLKAEGHVRIHLSISMEVMEILLNIIHGASRKVPRQVTLDILRQLAILVSGFGMLDTVEFFSDTWIDNLMRDELPKTYDGRVLPLTFIFWVFNRPTEFKDMTRLAQRESTERLLDDIKDLPIASNIMDVLVRTREQAMIAAVEVIHRLIDKYMAGKTLCDGSLDDELRYACDAMILGSLLKGARNIGIWPKPEAPFNGVTFQQLAKKIRGIRILDVCNKSSSRRWTAHGPGSNCHDLEQDIETEVKRLESKLGGLKLDEYAMKSDDLQSEFHKLTGPLFTNELLEIASPGQAILEDPIPQETAEQQDIAEAIADAAASDQTTMEELLDDTDDDLRNSSDEEDREIDRLLEEHHDYPVLATNGSINFAKMEQIAKEMEDEAFEVHSPKHGSRQSFYQEPQDSSLGASHGMEEPLQDEVRMALHQNFLPDSHSSAPRTSSIGEFHEVKVDSRFTEQQPRRMPREDPRDYPTIDARISPKVRFQDTQTERGLQQEVRNSPRHSSPEHREPEVRKSPVQHRSLPRGVEIKTSQRDDVTEHVKMEHAQKGAHSHQKEDLKVSPRHSITEQHHPELHNSSANYRDLREKEARQSPRNSTMEQRVSDSRSSPETYRNSFKEEARATSRPQPTNIHQDTRVSPTQSNRHRLSQESRSSSRVLVEEQHSATPASTRSNNGSGFHQEARAVSSSQSRPDARDPPTINNGRMATKETNGALVPQGEVRGSSISNVHKPKDDVKGNKEIHPEIRLSPKPNNSYSPKEENKLPRTFSTQESRTQARISPAQNHREKPIEEFKKDSKSETRAPQSNSRSVPIASNGSRLKEEVQLPPRPPIKGTQLEGRVLSTSNHQGGPNKPIPATPTTQQNKRTSQPPAPTTAAAPVLVRDPPKTSFQVAFEEEMKAIALEHSRESQHPALRAPSKDNFQEPHSIETSIPQTIIPRKAIVTQPDPPLRETKKEQLRDEVQPLTERKLNRVSSYTNILRDEVNSPVHDLHLTPKLASIEEMVEKSPSSPQEKDVKSLPAEQRKFTSPVLDVKSILKKTAPVVEEEDLAWAPPGNFKIRKSKKTFSTRY